MIEQHIDIADDCIKIQHPLFCHEEVEKNLKLVPRFERSIKSITCNKEDGLITVLFDEKKQLQKSLSIKQLRW